MRGKLVSTRERNMLTRFRYDTVGFYARDLVKCESNVRTAQRLEIALVAHNAPASECCNLFT